MRNSGSKSKNVYLNQIAIIFSVDLDEADFCKTCSDHIRKRNVPNLAANYGFRYPEQPSCLSELNDLEERLVALRIPFMQIRELGWDRQYGIKGSVTNVPNDLHKSVDCLPRNINDSATIYVKLKKRLSFKSHFMYQCFNPKRVYNAALYLMNKPLYQSQNNDESDIDDDDYDDPFVNPAPAETVINKLNTNIDAGFALAPGEDQMPLSLLFDDLAEELSYPRIYCGDMRRFTRKKPPTYSEIVKSELRRYDRRGATPQKFFYSHQKNLHKLLLNSIQFCLRNKILTDSSFIAQQVQDQQCLRQLFYKNKAYKFMKTIKCSPAQWENEKNRVCAQIRQFGMPTLFLTMSAAISCTNNANTKNANTKNADTHGYLYTDEVYFEDTASVLETMMAARKFQVHPLVSKCESQLKFSEITEENACRTLQLAIENKIEPLKDRCSEFIQDNTRDVIRSNGFKTSTLSIVRAICKLPKLNLNSEDELFEAILEWTKSQTSSQESKRDLLLPLLKHIRILSITGMKFTQMVQKCPDIFTAEEAMHVVMYLANPEASSTAKLPSWCNKSKNRCISAPSVNAAHQIQNFEKKLTISLKSFPRGNLSNLMNVLELRCIDGRHVIKALKLVFGDPVTDHSTIGHMVITATCLGTNYSFKEHLTIKKSKELFVNLKRTVMVRNGLTVTLRAEANEVKNYNFLQFDETNHSKDNGPFICNLGSSPKENRLYFISEVIYRNLPPRRRREPSIHPRPEKATPFSGWSTI
ncbi:ATP-dependent DNA helicase [Caerostris darwini]|uniref:ATP-dependent DNA helicase n=1 Tax=Caerostris darwini TaxID=1538125 RepID=A0AAV4QS19_9ARAC|nr:ATP-dependent DNA helicase [Caerostris darwini]